MLRFTLTSTKLKKLIMKIESLIIPDVKVITPKIFEDERGFFYESFNQKHFEDRIGRKISFVQDNHSFSKKNVIRGLHFQNKPFSQGKLVRVVSGEVLDIAVDLRKESKYYKKWISYNLSEKSHNQLWVPEGFAHGFIVLSDFATVLYKATNYYSKEHEGGIHPFDEQINIKWPVDKKLCILSSKDSSLPKFK